MRCAQLLCFVTTVSTSATALAGWRCRPQLVPFFGRDVPEVLPRRQDALTRDVCRYFSHLIGFLERRVRGWDTPVPFINVPVVVEVALKDPRDYELVLPRPRQFAVRSLCYDSQKDCA